MRAFAEKKLLRDCTPPWIKERSEGIDAKAYDTLSGCNYSFGVVTMQGWNKHDYVGMLQQAMTSSPNLIRCASELYGTSRLQPNFYEYKYSFGRPDENDGKVFEFFHAGSMPLCRHLILFRLQLR
jgi:hypothetical protein